MKGRYQDIVFSEPVEQYLLIAAEQMNGEFPSTIDATALRTLYDLSRRCRFITDGFQFETAQRLSPLDPMAAQCLVLAIQRYGQNERSLFTFLAAKGSNSISEFEPTEHQSYKLQKVY